MMYPARGGLVWGQMRGCYLKSGGITPVRPRLHRVTITSPRLSDGRS